MGVNTLISVEEYLHSAFSPDMEYVDGVLEEINVGDPSHGAVQRNICVAVANRYSKMRAYPEVRSRTRETRFRLPDVAVATRKAEGRYLAEPPFDAIEILAEEDRISRLIKLREYTEWGIANIWVFDRRTRQMYVFQQNAMVEITGDTIVTESPRLEFTRDEIFQD
jgi:Uma2 family endonuclease